MSHLFDRVYEGERDLGLVIDLLLSERAVNHRHLEQYPTVWRLRLLLATRLWEPERDARVWEDEAGRCDGFAFLCRCRREGSGNGLEAILDPQANQEELFAEMLTWAQRRMRECANERTEAASLGLALGKEESGKIVVLEWRGFQRGEGFNVYMACTLDGAIARPEVPEGFSVRLLAGEDELEAYQALYGFAAVTSEHRRELIASQEYEHFVAVAPDGALVAYCECSFSREEWERSGRRTGWIDYMGTLTDFRRRGLGRAVMLAALQWLQSQGAETAMLITMDSNGQAHRVFFAVGFEIAAYDVVYEQTIMPA